MSEAPFIDPEAVDWATVVAAEYRIDQTIRYDYPKPIRDLRHRLVISPRVAHGDQRRVSHELLVTPRVPAQLGADPFGNEILALDVPYVEESIAFVLRSTVVRDARLGPHVLAVRTLGDRTLHGRRRLIRVDDALADAAASLRAQYRAPDELAEAIVRFVHAEMIYTKAVTDIFTTASVAFRMRRGVCQDYAHVVIALARACGLTARYVSGHLLGEGATHAWVEFLIPNGRDTAHVHSFDPTTGRRTGWRYLVVAVGRDYEDVAPTSGVFVGEPGGRIGTQQTVRITNLTRAA